MIKLIEIGPDDPTRNLRQIRPGVFATGRELLVSPEMIEKHLPGHIAPSVLKSRIALLENPIYELFLPDDDKAERLSED